MNTEMLVKLRALTCASMKDCKEALEATGWSNIDAAVDVVKAKGQAIADARASKPAAEGVVDVYEGPYGDDHRVTALIELNCQTDFVGRSEEFTKLAHNYAIELAACTFTNDAFNPASLDAARTELIGKTKENIVLRRWWAEETTHPAQRIFHYVHSNGKIGVLIKIEAESVEVANSDAFKTLGEELAMQIAAQNPIALSVDKLDPADIERQKAIFQLSVKEDKKPEAMWDKIVAGKMTRWQKETVLLEQESVIHPKKMVKDLLGSAKVVNFVRAVVGENVLVERRNLVSEIAKLLGV